MNRAKFVGAYVKNQLLDFFSAEITDLFIATRTNADVLRTHTMVIKCDVHSLLCIYVFVGPSLATDFLVVVVLPDLPMSDLSLAAPNASSLEVEDTPAGGETGVRGWCGGGGGGGGMAALSGLRGAPAALTCVEVDANNVVMDGGSRDLEEVSTLTGCKGRVGGGFEDGLMTTDGG